jgi:hypothetical protein
MLDRCRLALDLPPGGGASMAPDNTALGFCRPVDPRDCGPDTLKVAPRLWAESTPTAGGKHPPGRLSAYKYLTLKKCPPKTSSDRTVATNGGLGASVEVAYTGKSVGRCSCVR